MTEQRLQEIEALVRKAEDLAGPYSRDEAFLASDQVADAVPELLAEVRRLREALTWAMRQIPAPAYRLPQNADYFDAHARARSALDGGGKP